MLMLAISNLARLCRDAESPPLREKPCGGHFPAGLGWGVFSLLSRARRFANQWSGSLIIRTGGRTWRCSRACLPPPSLVSSQPLLTGCPATANHFHVEEFTIIEFPQGLPWRQMALSWTIPEREDGRGGEGRKMEEEEREGRWKRRRGEWYRCVISS
jgi:hypothetical protein